MENKKDIPGLECQFKFISEEEERQLIRQINKQKWDTSLKRRTQHYGYQYSYSKTNTLQKAEPIPEAFIPIKNKIQSYIFEHLQRKCCFNQLIMNEYEPGQGISPHIDNKVLFDDLIVSLSLGSSAVMVFQHGLSKVQIVLHRRQLLILSGEARQSWKHSIPARKKDDGVMRGVRISMTFRTVKEKYEEKIIKQKVLGVE